MKTLYEELENTLVEYFDNAVQELMNKLKNTRKESKELLEDEKILRRNTMESKNTSTLKEKYERDTKITDWWYVNYSAFNTIEEDSQLPPFIGMVEVVGESSLELDTLNEIDDPNSFLFNHFHYLSTRRVKKEHIWKSHKTLLLIEGSRYFKTREEAFADVFKMIEKTKLFIYTLKPLFDVEDFEPLKRMKKFFEKHSLNIVQKNWRYSRKRFSSSKIIKTTAKLLNGEEVEYNGCSKNLSSKNSFYYWHNYKYEFLGIGFRCIHDGIKQPEREKTRLYGFWRKKKDDLDCDSSLSSVVKPLLENLYKEKLDNRINQFSKKKEN